VQLLPQSSRILHPAQSIQVSVANWNDHGSPVVDCLVNVYSEGEELSFMCPEAEAIALKEECNRLKLPQSIIFLTL
jgi:hypothetical protein